LRLDGDLLEIGCGLIKFFEAIKRCCHSKPGFIGLGVLREALQETLVLFYRPLKVSSEKLILGDQEKHARDGRVGRKLRNELRAACCAAVVFSALMLARRSQLKGISSK